MSLIADHHRCAQRDGDKGHGGHGYCSDECQRKAELEAEVRRRQYDPEFLAELASGLDFEANQQINLASKIGIDHRWARAERAGHAAAAAEALRQLVQCRITTAEQAGLAA